MKRSLSLPKIRMREGFQPTLNRLTQKAKPRLQFPKRMQSKKHFFDYHGSNIIIGNYTNQESPMKEGQKRNTMDIGDIQGVRPRLIEKQKNVINYYKNTNQEYDPYAQRSAQIQKSASQPKRLNRLRTQRHQQIDSLDIFQKQLSTHRYMLNQESKKQFTEPIPILNHNKILADKLSIQSRNPISNNSKIFSNNSRILNSVQRQEPSYNPTFLSNIFLQ